MAACGGGGSDGDVDAEVPDVDAAVPDAELPPDADTRFALGESCGSADDCQSGFCETGVCCASACGAAECAADGSACETACVAHADCAEGGICVAGACAFGKWAFTTSTTINGNIGGLDGGDAFCQARADAVGLPGTYRAWLGDTTGSPSTRFTQPTVPYYLPASDGAVIKLADDYADLTDDTIDAPFNRAETGAVVSSNIPYTNVEGNGTTYAGQGHCANWTSASPSLTGISGYSEITAEAWTLNTDTGCEVVHRLYCFEQ